MKPFYVFIAIVGSLCSSQALQANARRCASVQAWLAQPLPPTFEELQKMVSALTEERADSMLKRLGSRPAGWDVPATSDLRSVLRLAQSRNVDPATLYRELVNDSEGPAVQAYRERAPQFNN